MTFDAPDLTAWDAAIMRSRNDYYAHLNEIERHDPSKCRESGCYEQRINDRITRCVVHQLAERVRRGAYDRERKRVRRNHVSPEQVAQAIQLRAEGVLWREIARDFGLTSRALAMAVGRAQKKEAS